MGPNWGNKSWNWLLGRRFFFFVSHDPTDPNFLLRRAKKKKFYLRPTLIFGPNNGPCVQIRYKHMTPKIIVIFTWTLPILQVFTSAHLCFWAFYSYCKATSFNLITKWSCSKDFSFLFFFIFLRPTDPSLFTPYDEKQNKKKGRPYLGRDILPLPPFLHTK